MTSPGSRFDLSAGELALDFANTWGDERPRSVGLDYDDLLAWSVQAGLLDDSAVERLRRTAAARPEETAATVDDARRLGMAIVGVFRRVASGGTPLDADVESLNRSLREALGRLRLRRGEACCTWTWSADDDDLDRMLWPVARSAAELLTSDRLDRVRECASPTCAWLFLDGSRNRSRKWCDMASCGNRAKARRFYRRHHQGSGPPDMS
jgi:predicted RNA-binding Zn ribbon-like protein